MEGLLILFGFPSTRAHLEVLPRSTFWRVSWTAAFAGGGLLLAPAVGLIPPHAPWAVGALGIGGVLAIRKWKERFTILSFSGACPKCGEPLSIRSGTALRAEMTVPCEACNHDSRLTVVVPASGAGPE